MKKIYLSMLALLLCFGVAEARKLTFYIGKTAITPGETVSFEDIVVDDYGDYREVTMAPELYLTSDIYSSKINITAKCTSGQSIQMCAGGACAMGETVTKENISIQTNAFLELKFDYIVELEGDEAIPVVVTEFSAVDTAYPETAVTFTLVMGEKGGVTLIENNADLVAVDGGIQYNVEQPTSLEIVDFQGRKVAEATVNGFGFLPIDAPAGVYVYTFGENSGKIYIK
ncbi:MAG: hypothetical protein ACI391_08580 [Muribaculaceae bacterium]